MTKRKIIFILAIFCVVVSALFFLYYSYNPEKEAGATSTDNVVGWGWSENIGWISANCYNDYDNDGALENHCSPQINPDTGNSYKNYGLNIDTIGNVATGEAWSENIGWIKFNPGGPYPIAPNNPAIYNPATKELSAWAKILTLDEKGWVKLQGPVVAAPANYELCRSCFAGSCDFCYEFSANNGSGKIGADCDTCVGAPASCGSCNNTYRYGVSALPYSIKNMNSAYVLEGWAWSDGNISGEGVGWIHFDYAYANSNPPLSFDELAIVPAQTSPPGTCKGADLSWEVSSWSNRYEIKRSDDSATSQDCNTASYTSSVFLNPFSTCAASSCLYQDAALEENKYYCYKVLAWNDTGFTEGSDSPKEIKTPLCPPENLVADGAVCGEINLSWDDKTGESGYKVYRSLENVTATSSATFVATLGANVTSYKDENIIPRYNYYYFVTALTPTDESAPGFISGQTLCYKGPGWEEK